MTSPTTFSLLTSAVSRGFKRFLRLNDINNEDRSFISVFEMLDDPGTHSLMQYLRNLIQLDVANSSLSTDLSKTTPASNDSSSTIMFLGSIGMFILLLLLLLLCIIRRTKMKIDALPHNNITQALLEHTNSDYLVCLGDSLTHGSVSANYIPILERLLSSDKHRSHLRIVNGGINSELVYNLRQRIDTVLQLRPKVVILMIGINDIKALAVPKCGIDSKRRMNLPQIPTLDFFIENMKEVLQMLQNGLSSDSEIYVCSIPPLGEDVDSSYNAIHISRANQLLREMTETTTIHKNKTSSSNKRGHTTTVRTPSMYYVPVFEECTKILRHHAQIKHQPFVSFEKWSLRRTILTSLLHYTFGIPWNTLGSMLYGYYIMIEGLHLNDRGAEIVARSIAATLQKLPMEDIRYSFMDEEHD